MIASQTKRLVLWLVTSCVLSPAMAAVVLAADKAYRMTRAGHRIGNETFAVAIFGAVELLIVAAVITLPAVCVAASIVAFREPSLARVVALGGLTVIVFSAIYSMVWGSVEWPFATGWAFTFFAWPLLLRSVRAKEPVV